MQKQRQSFKASIPAGSKPRIISALRRKDHEQHPVGRVGRPEDVAELVSWLLEIRAGDEAGALDGCMTRKMIYEE